MYFEAFYKQSVPEKAHNLCMKTRAFQMQSPEYGKILFTLKNICLKCSQSWRGKKIFPARRCKIKTACISLPAVRIHYIAILITSLLQEHRFWLTTISSFFFVLKNLVFCRRRLENTNVYKRWLCNPNITCKLVRYLSKENSEVWKFSFRMSKKKKCNI